MAGLQGRPPCFSPAQGRTALFPVGATPGAVASEPEAGGARGAGRAVREARAGRGIPSSAVSHALKVPLCPPRPLCQSQGVSSKSAPNTLCFPPYEQVPRVSQLLRVPLSHPWVPV